MARPRYIICAQDQLVDQSTGLISHVHVIDRFVLRASPLPSNIPADAKVLVPDIPIGKMIATAVWTKDEEDGECTFDYEMLLHKPGEEARTIQTGEFRFLKHFFRIDAGLLFSTRTKFEASGEMIVESRIKKRGTENWLSQRFPIDVELVSSDPGKIEEAQAESANQ